MINFFSSTIEIRIAVLKNSHVRLTTGASVLLEGKKEDCMSKLYSMVSGLPGLDGKTINFIIDTVEEPDSFECAETKRYLITRLNRMGSSLKCKVLVLYHLYYLA